MLGTHSYYLYVDEEEPVVDDMTKIAHLQMRFATACVRPYLRRRRLLALGGIRLYRHAVDV